MSSRKIDFSKYSKNLVLELYIIHNYKRDLLALSIV